MGWDPSGSSASLGEVEVENTATGSILPVDQLLRTKLIQPLLAPSSHHGLLPKAAIYDSVSYTWHGVHWGDPHVSL